MLGAAAGHGNLGAVIALATIALHFRGADDRRRDFRLVVLAAAIGLAAETMHQATGLLRYADPLPVAPWLAPPWILTMWAQFGTTLRHSLAWLVRRPFRAAALGLVGGPLAFRAGEALGAVTFGPNRPATYASLAAVWGVAMLALSIAARPAEGSSGARVSR